MFQVLITDPVSDQGIEKLLEAPDVEVIRKTDLSMDQLLEEISTADALIVRSQTQVTDRVIQAGRKLKAIGRAGVGVDNIDISAATARGIIVVNAPDGNTISTAEHTFAMLISLARNIPQGTGIRRPGRMETKTVCRRGVEPQNPGHCRFGKNRDRVGQAGPRIPHERDRLRSLSDRRAGEKSRDSASHLEEVITAADFLTVHTPLTKETRHLIDADAFAKMKEGVRVLNCARGASSTKMPSSMRSKAEKWRAPPGCV